MTLRAAWGLGLASIASDGTVLDTWYPQPRLGAAPASPTTDDPLGAELRALETSDDARGVRRVLVTTVIDLDEAPAGASDAYLRLHLLSHRLVAPHGLDLTGVFGHLANVVWTSAGPCSPVDFEV